MPWLEGLRGELIAVSSFLWRPRTRTAGRNLFVKHSRSGMARVDTGTRPMPLTPVLIVKRAPKTPFRRRKCRALALSPAPEPAERTAATCIVPLDAG